MTVASAVSTRSFVKAVDVIFAPARKVHRQTYRQARNSLVFMLIFLAISHVVLTQGMDHVFPTVRDPEYGRRLSRYLARVAEHPDRTTILLLGSSRTALGVHPETIHAENAAGPRVFNFSVFGSGPVMQVMMLRRLLAEGHIPQAVLMEYWPAFVRGDGNYAEEARIDPHRLLPIDRPFIRDYYSNAELAEATMKHVRRVTWYEHRTRLMSQIVPGWLPWEKRLDGPWAKLGPWGWLPGDEVAPPAAERTARVNFSALYFRPLFESFRVAPAADQAIHEIARICRQREIPLALLWMPESTEFVHWIEPARSAIQSHVDQLRCELHLPIIDAHDWVPDELLTDGFHLSQPGAEHLSRKLATELPLFFPAQSRARP